MARLLRSILGRVLNAVGTPGFIRARTCHERLGVPVEILVDDLFTIVMVKNVRLMFHRLSGQFDGIVLESADCQERRDRLA
jgi:hypothetical protein